MNYNEILEQLKTKMTIREFAFEDYEHPIEGIGEVSEVKEFGGEGQGDTWYSIKYFKDHDVYIEVLGSYSSDNGVDLWDGWGCCSEVAPHEKVITVYHQVK